MNQHKRAMEIAEKMDSGLYRPTSWSDMADFFEPFLNDAYAEGAADRDNANARINKMRHDELRLRFSPNQPMGDGE